MANVLNDLQLRRLQLRNQQSTVEMRKDHAVAIRHAYKSYGNKANPVRVVEDLNMTVPRGCIYGLLGASGCGKTTLINCIVGRKRLDSGEIWVLGGAPNSKESGVPGTRLGYMPQQIALYGDFTIAETMKFFGWISDMTLERIKKRSQFLVELLNLPNSNQLVKTLSGGQQRRVSLAIALLHEPELLILDEPTVGLDPVLRESIWKFLLQITRTSNTTIVLTTHYIDETRKATFVGLMRGGYILDEEPPQNLLDRFCTDTLEEAFLKLSVLQNLGHNRRSSLTQEVASVTTVPSGVINQAVIMDDDDSIDSEVSGEFGDHIPGKLARRVSLSSLDAVPVSSPSLPTDFPSTKTIHYSYTLLSFKASHIKAILWKNILWLTRNLPLLFLTVGFPILLVCLFCLALGREPVDLPVAVINYETDNNPCNETLSCNSSTLSCHYLERIGAAHFNLKYYDSEESAIESVLHGDTYASIVIKHNYTLALKKRFGSWNKPDEWSIDFSTIDVFRDVAVRDMAFFVKAYLYEGLQEFIGDYMQLCGIASNVFHLPVQLKKPIYGPLRPQFSEFMLPGIILTASFFVAIALTGVSMLTERKEGILERSLVLGVNPIENLIARFICDSVLVTAQVIMILIFSFIVFNMSLIGSWFLVTILTLLAGLLGMSTGLAISAATDDEVLATMAAAGIFFPIFILSGLIWPVEGMHFYLQKISVVLPFTKATESMRTILQRGWGFLEPVVYEGFIVLTSWIIIILIISILCLKYRP